MKTKLTEDIHIKKSWTSPQLTVYGSVEKITGQGLKQIGGAGDGLTFNGMPLSTVVETGS